MVASVRHARQEPDLTLALGVSRESPEGITCLAASWTDMSAFNAVFPTIGGIGHATSLWLLKKLLTVRRDDPAPEPWYNYPMWWFSTLCVCVCAGEEEGRVWEEGRVAWEERGKVGAGCDHEGTASPFLCRLLLLSLLLLHMPVFG